MKSFSENIGFDGKCLVTITQIRHFANKVNFLRAQAVAHRRQINRRQIILRCERNGVNRCAQVDEICTVCKQQK